MRLRAAFPTCPCRPACSLPESRVPLWAGVLPECIPGVQRPAGLRGWLRRGGELLCALPAVLHSSLLPLAPGPCECQQPWGRGLPCHDALVRLQKGALYPQGGQLMVPFPTAVLVWPRLSAC